MKQDKGDWTAAVRRALDRIEQPLPEKGWERLEYELRKPVAPAVSSRKIWIKFAAAAAAVLVCVSIGIRVIRSDRYVLERVVMVSEAAVSEQNTGAGETTAPAPDLITAPEEPAVLQALRVEVAFAEQPEHVGAPVQARESLQDQRPAPDEAVSQSRAALGAQAEKPQYNTSDYDGLFAEAASVPRKGGSVALFAGGVVTSAAGAGISPATLLVITEGAASLRHAYEEFSYDHKQPLSFGAMFRKELGRGFSVESGLTYTLLRSSVSIPGSVRNVSQKLHLVGIPVRLNWEFLRRGGFSLYVGAGGMAEKCVSARFAGEKVTEKGLQWSLFGAVGAQYRLGKTVGIYFEPEVSHYLTKTTLRTPYTDSSVNLSLQLGVRFNY